MNEHDEKNGILDFPGNNPDLNPDNSDIEALYRETVNREVPDFWSKIESGLDDPRYADGFSGFEASDGVQADIQTDTRVDTQVEKQVDTQAEMRVEMQVEMQTDTQPVVQGGIQNDAFRATETGINGSMDQVNRGTPTGTTSSSDRFAAFVQDQEAERQRMSGNSPAGKDGNAGSISSNNSGRNAGNNNGNNSGNKRRYGYWIGGLAAAAVVIILSVFAIANAGKRTKSNEANTSTSDIVSDQAKADNTLSYEDADDENVGKAESKEESQSNEQKSSGKRGAEGSVPSNLDIDGFNKGTNSYTVDRLTEDTTIAEAEQAEAPEPRDSTESMLPEAEKQDPKLYKDEMKTLGITLRLQNVRSTGCVLMFTREEDTKEETGTIFTSPEYEIEKWNGSSWEIYPHVKEVIFDDEQWALVKGKVNTYVADWWLDYGSLVGGKYRVIKMLYTDRDYDGYDEFRIAAEFEIN